MQSAYVADFGEKQYAHTICYCLKSTSDRIALMLLSSVVLFRSLSYAANIYVLLIGCIEVGHLSVVRGGVRAGVRGSPTIDINCKAGATLPSSFIVGVDNGLHG